MNRGDYIEAYFDLSTCKADPTNPNKQNILSIGENISQWNVNGKYNLHFYFPDPTEPMMMRYSFTLGQKVPGKNYVKRMMGKAYITDVSNVTIRIDKNGLWIDGVLLDRTNCIYGDNNPNEPSSIDYYYEWMDYFLSKPITGLTVGSIEGVNRSYANYIEIKATQIIPNI